MIVSKMNAASQVFHIPELLELILLALPYHTIHTEISSMRTIHTSQLASRTWHDLIQNSTPLGQRLYLPTPLDASESQRWNERSAFPPSAPNPWIPHILLNQRSWGNAWPFGDSNYTQTLYEGSTGPTKPKFWTFHLEFSRKHYERLPTAGAWRQQLASSPPFTDFWYTRCFYELGSGRAPFVTHLDYNPKKPKSQQKHVVHRAAGVTLGDLVDAYTHLFQLHSTAKWVMIESSRSESDGEVKLADDRPITKTYMPGL